MNAYLAGAIARLLSDHFNLRDDAEKRSTLPRLAVKPGGGAFPPPADSPTGAAEVGCNGPTSRQGHTAAPAIPSWLRGWRNANGTRKPGTETRAALNAALRALVRS